MGDRVFGRAVKAIAQVASAPKRFALFLERRRRDRRRMLAPGKLVFGNMMGAVDCTIGDISTGGARVRIAREKPVPDDLFLVHLREWTAYRARVVWRRSDGNLGLAFRKSHDLEGALTPNLRSMREYCAAHATKP